jgi:ketosteroid isomerase-like protein
VAQENVEIVRRVMNAFNERDITTFLADMAPTVQFFAPETAAAAGRKSLYRGHDGVRQFFRDVENVWDSLQVRAQDFRLTDDCVVAIGRATGERSGEKLDEPVTWAWRLQDGKVLWGRAYEKLEDALQDVGAPRTELDLRADP